MVWRVAWGCNKSRLKLPVAVDTLGVLVGCREHGGQRRWSSLGDWQAEAVGVTGLGGPGYGTPGAPW